MVFGSPILGNPHVSEKTSVKSSDQQAAAKEKDWQQHAARMIFGCSTQLSQKQSRHIFVAGRSIESWCDGLSRKNGTPNPVLVYRVSF